MVIKINGVQQALKWVLEPEKVEKAKSWMDRINEFSDSVIQKEIEWFVHPLQEGVKDGFLGVIKVLNSFSLEIIILGVVFCGIGMIVAPLIGSSSGKWFGRTVFVMLVGAVWRILI